MNRRSLLIVAFALVLVAPSASAQADAWQKKWYWGAEGGIFTYTDPVSGDGEMAITAGGHWMITGKKTALFISVDQILFGDSSQAVIADPSAAATGGLRLVDFTSGRRIQASIFAIPMDKKLQLMIGGGFSINQINGAVAQGPFATLQEAINANNTVAELDTKAFMVAAVGAQYRFGRWAAFAHFNYMPAAQDFLVPGDAMALTAGIRYALTSAHEEISTDR